MARSFSCACWALPVALLLASAAAKPTQTPVALPAAAEPTEAPTPTPAVTQPEELADLGSLWFGLLTGVRSAADSGQATSGAYIHIVS